MSRHSHPPAVIAPARSMRAAGGVAVAVIAGSAGHLAGGGSWSAQPIVVAALLLLGPAWVLSRRERSLPSIAALLASGQLVTHVALAVSTSPCGCRPAGMPAMSMVPTGPMVLYHLMAALVVGWWLRQGERRLWEGARRVVAAVCRCVCHLLHTTAAACPACGEVAVIPAPDAGAHRSRVVLRHAIVLRGPPASG